MNVSIPAPVTLLASITVPGPAPRNNRSVARLTVLLMMNMPPPCWTTTGALPANVSAAPIMTFVPVDELFSTSVLLVYELLPVVRLLLAV